MSRTELNDSLEAELLETGLLLDYYLSLVGRSAREQQVLDGIVFKLMGRHMRLMNERSEINALLQEINQQHPVPVILHIEVYG